MVITIIGSGNVASALAKLCVQKGHTIQQIIARNEQAAKELATQVGGKSADITDCELLEADLIIVALSDNSLPGAIEQIDFKEIPVVHTAGSVSINVLKNIALNYGVLYPLQSLRKSMEVIPQIPFLIEANNDKTENFIKNFALTLSDDVKVTNEADRLKLHVAAVVVNNFTNYLYSLAENFCKKENVDFNLLKPLIKETAERIQDHSPRSMQTGPAIRNDSVTIIKHLQLLYAYPKLKEVYVKLTDGLMNKE